ncbi:MAG TPA: hypothetical protein VML19_05000 [Verrucomicrobiae bacterium]|nr:hypothetical protein [Verrucomicrobiae bacterium]
MPIPTKTDWLSWTERKHKIRSMALRKVDDAIGAYGKSPGRQAELDIRKAFMAWKREKGPDWAKSERNQAPHFAITALDEALRKDLGMGPEELAALQVWKDERTKNIQRVFENATITLRLFNGLASVRQAKQDLEKAVRESKQAAGSAARGTAEMLAQKALGEQIAEVREALSDMFGVVITDVLQFGQTVLADTGLQGMLAVADQVANMLPLISVIAGGVKTLAAAGMAVKKGYDQWSFSRHEGAFESGNAAAAFDAVKTLLARETANQTAKAGIEATAFAANTALHAAKGVGAVLAPAVGAAKACANAARVITKFAIECRETLIARKELKNPDQLDLRVFNRCPLLGAYMLIGSDTSDLVALLFEEFGQDGWMDDVESLMKKHIKPALDQCESLIQSSPFIVTGVPAHRKITGTSTITSMLSSLA